VPLRYRVPPALDNAKGVRPRVSWRTQCSRQLPKIGESRDFALGKARMTSEWASIYSGSREASAPLLGIKRQ
jgi:hypothetical protein